MSAHVLIIDLGDGASQKPRVLRQFDHHRTRNVTFKDRIVAGRNGSAEDEEVKSDSDEEDESPVSANVLRIAISADGQWLATSDDLLRTHVFNMDSIQVHYLSCW